MGQSNVKSDDKVNKRIILHGLDGAGKTTLLYRLKYGTHLKPVPTMGFNEETMEYRNIKFTVLDLGRGEKVRTLWREYGFYKNIDAVVFVVDSANPERFGEIRDEIERTVEAEELQECIVVIAMNKQDLEDAVLSYKIEQELNIDNTLKSQSYRVFATSGRNGDGLFNVIDWLASELNEKDLKSMAKDQDEELCAISYFRDAISYVERLITE